MSAGYAIVDFKGYDFATQERVEIPGIFDKLSDAYFTHKTLVVVNAKYDGKYVSPVMLFAYDTKEGSIQLSTGHKVEPDDYITV